MAATVEGAKVTQDDEFRSFVTGTQGRLLHVADLLTGDRGRAEDLVQHAFVKTYLAWRRVRDGDPEAYARVVLLNAGRDFWRRRRWREETTAALPDIGHVDETATVGERDQLHRALSRLTARERQVVVLRHYLGLTEVETAAELGLAVGTVKSATARALAKLRQDATLELEQ